MFKSLPLGGLELVLVAILVLIGGLVIRGVKRRREFVGAIVDTELPDLKTQQRLNGTLRRLWRDPDQGLPLAELGLGNRKFIFCPTDHATRASVYEGTVGKKTDVALFGLATLAIGGVDAIRHQIKDIDKVDITPDDVRLIHEGQFQNDYFVIGRILSRTDDRWGEMALSVYRVQVIQTTDMTLVLELAVPDDPQVPRLENGALAHGSARLFGYLP